MKKIMLTGANGQLGQELQRCAWPGDWRVVPFQRDDLDLADPAAIAAAVAADDWAIVINCAAYTAVDKAETDIAIAWMVNAMAPAAFAQACVTATIPLIQISTDYVFDGQRTGAWDVHDPVAPMNVYGASKLGGELAVRTSGVRHAIIRTAWLVSPHGNNFVKTMLRLAQSNDRLRVVADQRGSPTSAADLARAIMAVAVRLVDDAQAPTGTFHFSNAGETNWADFAGEIFRQSGARGGTTAGIDPITTAQYPTPAHRPANSLLSTEAITTAYGLVPRPWDEALGDILDELIGAKK